MRHPLLFALFLGLAAASPFAAAQKVVDVPTRPGVTQRFLYIAPPAPKAAVVLFAGGHGGLHISDSGAFGWGGGNFLVRHAPAFRRPGTGGGSGRCAFRPPEPQWLSGHARARRRYQGGHRMAERQRQGAGVARRHQPRHAIRRLRRHPARVRRRTRRHRPHLHHTHRPALDPGAGHAAGNAENPGAGRASRGGWVPAVPVRRHAASDE